MTDRQTSHLTNEPISQQTEVTVHSEVALPIIQLSQTFPLKWEWKITSYVEVVPKLSFNCLERPYMLKEYMLYIIPFPDGCAYSQTGN